MNGWNALIARLPNPHLLQTYEWGLIKSKNGWSPLYAWWEAGGKFHLDNTAPQEADAAAAAMILKKSINRRSFAARLCVLYAPKGPLLDWQDASLRTRVLSDLESLAKKQSAIFLKVDPDLVLAEGLPGAVDESPDEQVKAITQELERRSWFPSTNQIQFRNTIIIDLTRPEEELLSRMKQKTRYNVRLAEKKGVSIRTGGLADLPMLYQMYAETSVRDGFVIREEEYYSMVWRTFMQSQSPHCEPLIAEVEGEPVAAILLFTFAGTAYYLTGMSRDAHREKMPAYLLQWEAMRRARAAGCTRYDLWGAPDEFIESDSMWGVYRFKEGLGGRAVRTAGAWDFAPNKLWYKTYSEVMPRLLDIMRRRGKERVRQSLE